jgi:hypothetical protein
MPLIAWLLIPTATFAAGWVAGGLAQATRNWLRARRGVHRIRTTSPARAYRPPGDWAVAEAGRLNLTDAERDTEEARLEALWDAPTYSRES